MLCAAMRFMSLVVLVHALLAGAPRAFGLARGVVASAGGPGVEKSVVTPASLRVASVSLTPTKWDKEGNWALIEQRVRAAAATGADLIITPEGALDGYVINEVSSVTL